MKLEIETDDTTAVIDAQGDAPYEDAQFALDRLLGDDIDADELERVFVVLQTALDDPDDDDPADGAAAGEQTVTKTSANSAATEASADGGTVAQQPGSGDGESDATGVLDGKQIQYSDTKEYDFLDEDDRSFGTCSANTVQHVILSILSATDGRLTSPEVSRRFETTTYETVVSALSRLCKKKLVERESVENATGRKYAYWLASHGEQVLRERGRTTPDEWAEN